MNTVPDFHLISIQLGQEKEMLERVTSELKKVEGEETVFLPEYVAWTPQGSTRAFERLGNYALEQNINIITTLNLGVDLAPDLPGSHSAGRVNALIVFTRHGIVHVPQAKITTQSFEMRDTSDSQKIRVSPYNRINRVRCDVDDNLIDVIFLISSDIVSFLWANPSDLRCDLLVLLGKFAYGAEATASKLLEHAVAAGIVRTAIHVNSYHIPNDKQQQPLAIKVEEVIDAIRHNRRNKDWPSPRSLRRDFLVYDDDKALDFDSMCNLSHNGRITVPKSRWNGPMELGAYPVTVVL